MMIQARTLVELLQANRAADRHITYVEGDGVERRVSYAELHRRALGILRRVQQLGAGRGDKLIVFLNNNEAFIDGLMWRYFDLLSFRPNADIARLRQEVAAGRNPRDVKFELGMEIVDRFHGAGSGARARDEFVARFSQGALPEDLAEITLTAVSGALGIAHVLKGAGLVPRPARPSGS